MRACFALSASVRVCVCVCGVIFSNPKPITTGCSLTAYFSLAPSELQPCLFITFLFIKLKFGDGRRGRGRKDRQASGVVAPPLRRNRLGLRLRLIMNTKQVRGAPGPTGGRGASQRFFSPPPPLLAHCCFGAGRLLLKPPAFCIRIIRGAPRWRNWFNQDGDKMRKAADSAALRERGLA